MTTLTTLSTTLKKSMSSITSTLGSVMTVGSTVLLNTERIASAGLSLTSSTFELIAGGIGIIIYIFSKL